MIPNKEKNANLNFYIFRLKVRNPRNGLPPNDFRIFQQIIRKQQKWKFEFLQQK